MENEITLPRGTVIHFHGLPCELTADTVVLSSAVAAMGMDSAAMSANGPAEGVDVG